MKIIYFSIVIVMISLSGFFLFRFFSNPETEGGDVGEYGSLPTDIPDNEVPNNIPALDTITIVSGTVVMRDVRKLPGTELLGSGLYNLQPLSAIPAADYNIVYDEGSQSFAAALYTEPLAATRQRMEQDLLQKTNLTEEELCKIPIFVSVPYEINEFISGDNLGISFCPKAVMLQ